LLNRSLNSFK